MATSQRNKAVLACQDPARAYESVLVTVTDTMKNGSLLVAAGTEAAIADAADVVGVIDDLKFDEGFYTTGDVILVPVAKRDSILNGSVLTFSDGERTNEALPLIAAAGNTIQTAVVDFSRLQ